MSERVSDPYGIKKLRRAFDDSQNRSGQVVGLPHVTIEASLVAHALASYDALSRDLAAALASLDDALGLLRKIGPYTVMDIWTADRDALMRKVGM